MILERAIFIAVYIAEALIAWLYFEFLFSKKTSFLFQLFTFLSGYALLFCISIFEKTTINALAFLIVNWYLLGTTYQCSSKTALLHSAFLCFIMIGAELLANLLIVFFGFEFAAYTYNIPIMAALVILSKLLYLMLSVIGSRIFAPHKHKQNDPGLMVLFCILPIVSALVACTIVYLGMNAGITNTIGIMIAIIVVTLFVVNLVILTLYNYLQKTNEEYLTLQLSIQQEQADLTYYQTLQEQFETQQILLHDFKKHLSIIDSLAKQIGASEIESYISTLDSSFAYSKQAKLCTDPILNLLLVRFNDECKRNKITFLCDVRANISTFMDAPSVTTLYGNLLSNAFEAADISEERLIDISVVKNIQQNNIIISVVNSCDSAPVSNHKGLFLSQKSGSGIHGVGLKSINRIVKKYRGVETMYYEETSHQFHHIIQLPISEEKEAQA